MICLLKAERDFEKRLDKLLAGFELTLYLISSEYFLKDRKQYLIRYIGELE